MHRRLEFVSDLLPATNGLFLGSDSKRWDGSKLLNLPGGGGKAYFTNLFWATQGTDDWYSLGFNASGGDVTTRTPMPAGKFTKLKINIVSNNLVGGAVSLTLCRNGNGTECSININPGVTGLLTWSGTVTISENDYMNWRLNALAPSSGDVTGILSLEFQAS